MSEKAESWRTAITEAQPKFKVLAVKSGLDYNAEALYAYQACTKNSRLAEVANSHPVSLRMAVVNVAAVGLTLNPALGLAFLVPRDGRVCLDISYRGLITIAVDSGAIRWAKAELVYANDKFEYRGPAKMPTHIFNPFSKDRGEFIGGYCVAGIGSGEEVLVEVMTVEDILRARNQSKAWQVHKGPWVEWFYEMAKKVLIKRAAKTWPRLNSRLGQAIKILNEDNGEGLVLDGQYESESGPTQADDPEKASTEARAKTAAVIERARAANAWQAAEDYIKSQFRGHDQAYALRELRKARNIEDDENAPPAEDCREAQ